MSQLAETIAEYHAKGLSCSQMLMTFVGLEARGEESEDLVTAMGGLSYGMYCQHTCGALSGAVCGLALHSESKEQLKTWCNQLSQWFEGRFGSVCCQDLVGRGQMNPELCAGVIEETTLKCLEMLEEAGCL